MKSLMGHFNFIIFLLLFLTASQGYGAGINCTSFTSPSNQNDGFSLNNPLNTDHLFTEDVNAALDMLSLASRFMYVAKEAYGIQLKDIAQELGLTPSRITTLFRKTKREVDEWSQKYRNDSNFFFSLALSKKKLLYKKNYDWAVSLASDGLMKAVMSFSLKDLEGPQRESVRQSNRKALGTFIESLRDSSQLDEAQTMEEIAESNKALVLKLQTRVRSMIKILKESGLISSESNSDLEAYYHFLFETIIRDPNMNLVNQAAKYRFHNFKADYRN